MGLQRIVRSCTVPAPIDTVWAVLRDFNRHARWHRAVAHSLIEEGLAPDQVGCVRRFALADGHRVREQLLGLSDHGWRSTYTIVEASLPLWRYVATVRLKPITDVRHTFWLWSCTFEAPPGLAQALAERVASGVYEAGFADLTRHVLGDGGQSPGQSAA